MTPTTTVLLPFTVLCQRGVSTRVLSDLHHHSDALRRAIDHIYTKVESKNRDANASVLLFKPHDIEAFWYELDAFSFALDVREITA